MLTTGAANRPARAVGVILVAVLIGPLTGFLLSALGLVLAPTLPWAFCAAQSMPCFPAWACWWFCWPW